MSTPFAPATPAAPPTAVAAAAGARPQPVADHAPTFGRAHHDTLLGQLHAVAQRIALDIPDTDLALLALMDQLDGHPDPRCVGLAAFAAGLARRLGGRAAQRADAAPAALAPAMLAELAARVVPFVGLASRLADAAVAEQMAGQAEATWIELGLGAGRLACQRIEALARQGRLPARLTVIGIDPDGAALQVAAQALAASARAAGSMLVFHAVASRVEALAETDWHAIAALCPTAPVVLALQLLHHLADDADGRDARDRVLRRLQALQPALLVLAEPDVDHLEPRFALRFANCFAHYAAVFRTLDRLPLAPAERDALKREHFGRQIADILGGPEHARHERHETAAMWARRLHAAGFELLPGCAELPRGDGVVGLQRHASHLSLDAVDMPVMALCFARPARCAAGGAAIGAELLALAA